MSIVSSDGLKFYSLTWALKLPASKHTDTNIWHARPFASTFYRQAYRFLGRISLQKRPARVLPVVDNQWERCTAVEQKYKSESIIICNVCLTFIKTRVEILQVHHFSTESPCLEMHFVHHSTVSFMPSE